ncbi:FxSxx-COOH cyclophane-containing RiPP peptide [Streptomyces sp. NPDC005281]|uniref:FxSxx-COOH cyclophane-containing RiPP peptide n=1 Tax=Streptomyces sp. NPDC005281 TaxID=3155712 RepID=UPI0033B26F19
MDWSQTSGPGIDADGLQNPGPGIDADSSQTLGPGIDEGRSQTHGPARAPEFGAAWSGPAMTPTPASPAGTPDPVSLTGTPDLADLPAPDLLDLDLARLRTVQHPVLEAVLADLRTRSEESSEILWGFNNAF